MNYIPCAEARPLTGLRLVLSAGSPGPWDEAAKAIFNVRNVPFIAVRKEGFGTDEDLFTWTGVRNAPVAMYDDERPRHTWLDILYLAERLGSGPSLLPDTREGQVECIGLSHQICGEDGLGWNRRLNLFKMMVEAAGGDPAQTILPLRMFKDYGGTNDAMAGATQRLIDILNMLSARLQRQKAAGSHYLVGDRLTAADLHFTAFAGMIDPLPIESNSMPQFLRDLYSSGEPRLRQAITPELMAHRDFIYRHHLKLPMDF